MTPRRRLPLAGAVVGLVVGASGCTPSEPPPGTLGIDREVYFEASSELALSERIGTGSEFFVTLRARRALPGDTRRSHPS